MTDQTTTDAEALARALYVHHVGRINLIRPEDHIWDNVPDYLRVVWLATADAALAWFAARPAAPTITTEQVRAAREAVNSFIPGSDYLPVGVGEWFLAELGIKVQP